MRSFKPSLGAYILILCTIVALPAQSNDITKSVSDFSLDFYEQCVKTKPGNVIISPFSVANSLALLSQGSSGKTFEELQRGLHLSGDKETVANQFHEYYDQLRRSVGDATLSIANQIYVQQGNQLNKHFQNVAETKFTSGVETLDFLNAAKSAEQINQFVEQKTNNKIKNFVKPEVITPDTLIFLVNAIYFKSNWEVQFSKKYTREGDFHISDDETVKTEFMFTKHIFNYVYVKDLQAKAIELKYANSSISFMIILPRSVSGLPELEAKMKNYNLNEISSQMDYTVVEVTLPKFKVEYDIELNQVLENLGMTRLFTSDANLDGLLESGKSIKVSKVLHKAFIEINEEGSEAAGATGTAGKNRRPGVVLPPAKFQADHPFMYFIRDTKNDAILFSGRYVKV